MQWTDEYFDEDYLFLYKSRLTSERTKREVDFLIKYAFDFSTKNILDMPCGYGRHAELLAERGYIVHGVDASEVMLKVAKENRSKLSIDVQNRLSYQRADMRTFRALDKFDAALNLFTSFGYFDSASENELVLKNLCMSVKKGGIVVLDIRNLARDIAELSKTGWTRETTEDEITIVQKLDPDSFKFTLTYKYQKDGEQKERTAVFKEYSIKTPIALFEKHGCKVEKTFGNFKGDAYTSESWRLIVVAKHQ
jgi:SAM-dependent methyltransferase